MIRISNLKLKINHTEDDIKSAILKKLHLRDVRLLSFDIIKKSLDARDKNNICWNYIIDFTTDNDKSVLKKPGFSIPEDKSYKLPDINKIKRINPDGRIIIAGSGPAGLFAAYFLALNGYRPLLIERGEPVEKRTAAINSFWNNESHLDRNSNVQFGEGGAGTFSDGKLNTGVNDPYGRNMLVLKTFVENGADPEILYISKPHLGTDQLVKIVKNMREKIIASGGEVLFNTKLTRIITDKNNAGKGQITKIEVTDILTKEIKEIECKNLILAIGHSARDTFTYLINKTDMEIVTKPFAVGIRIQHSQDAINKAQYGENYKEIYGDSLPPADYKLVTKTSNGESVYSFCMCPGGYVVNSASEPGGICVNGMSYSGRGSDCANSALIIGLEPYDDPLNNIDYQRELEIRAFKSGGGRIPVQLFEDFEKNRVSIGFGSVKPCFKGETAFGDINSILDPEECEALKEAIHIFAKKIKGYDDGDAVIAGVESRTTSPLRMVRDEHFESNITGIFPCGEGAGYAGGITSAAIDGIKVFEELYRRYLPYVIE